MPRRREPARHYLNEACNENAHHHGRRIGQQFSEGAALNGRIRTRGNAAGKAAELTWVPQEKAELSGMQQEVERIHMQTQLIQARTILAETEARYREATSKSSGKN